MQSGTDDCGLFAIAFATALVHNEHPGKFLFKQDSMKQHLAYGMPRAWRDDCFQLNEPDEMQVASKAKTLLKYMLLPDA